MVWELALPIVLFVVLVALLPARVLLARGGWDDKSWLKTIFGALCFCLLLSLIAVARFKQEAAFSLSENIFRWHPGFEVSFVLSAQRFLWFSSILFSGLVLCFLQWRGLIRMAESSLGCPMVLGLGVLFLLIFSEKLLLSFFFAELLWVIQFISHARAPRVDELRGEGLSYALRVLVVFSTIALSLLLSLAGILVAEDAFILVLFGYLFSYVIFSRQDATWDRVQEMLFRVAVVFFLGTTLAKQHAVGGVFSFLPAPFAAACLFLGICSFAGLQTARAYFMFLSGMSYLFLLFSVAFPGAIERGQAHGPLLHFSLSSILPLLIVMRQKSLRAGAAKLFAANLSLFLALFFILVLTSFAAIDESSDQILNFIFAVGGVCGTFLLAGLSRGANDTAAVEADTGPNDFPLSVLLALLTPVVALICAFSLEEVGAPYLAILPEGSTTSIYLVSGIGMAAIVFFLMGFFLRKENPIARSLSSLDNQDIPYFLSRRLQDGCLAASSVIVAMFERVEILVKRDLSGYLSRFAEIICAGDRRVFTEFFPGETRQYFVSLSLFLRVISGSSIRGYIFLAEVVLILFLLVYFAGVI